VRKRWPRLKGKEILRVEGLKVNFYTYAGVVKALDGVSFTVYSGEAFALVGETGCGKSVTMRSILRLVPPPGRIVAGRILFKGIDLLKLPENEIRKIRGAKIAMIVQDPNAALDPLFTAGQQVAETITAHEGVNDKNKLWQRVLKLFKDVAIPDPAQRAKAYPVELSGGMKQRVVISIALSEAPELLIADEPTTAVDVTIQAQILDLLKGLQKKYGMTLIFVTHNLGVVAEVCERLAVMYAGNIVEIGAVTDVFKEPLHPYTKGLLEAVPIITKSQIRLKPIPGSIPNLINPPPGCRFHPRCPYATSRCRTKKPELTEVKPGRLVACHLYR